jgi:hypothetical protein
MYPTGDLDRLSVRKALIRVKIAEHRWQCVQAGSSLARPIEVVDGLVAKWRRISPFAKIIGAPLLLLLARKMSRRLGPLATIARAMPLVFQTARMFAGRKS